MISESQEIKKKQYVFRSHVRDKVVEDHAKKKKGKVRRSERANNKGEPNFIRDNRPLLDNSVDELGLPCALDLLTHEDTATSKLLPRSLSSTAIAHSHVFVAG